MGYADVAEIIGPRVRENLDDLWPPPPAASATGPVSLVALIDRYAEAGRALRVFRTGSAPGVWPRLNRATVAEELRRRIVDPAVMNQKMTGLCGPMSVLFELGRRDPAEYVRIAAELFETGSFLTSTNRRIAAEGELRRERVPQGRWSNGVRWTMAQVDWMLAGTMRDDENAFEDVDGAAGLLGAFLGTAFGGLETLTWPAEEKGWIIDVLGLRGDVDACETAGENDALQAGDAAVRAGGVAILCIDANLLTHSPGDDEEEVFHSHVTHTWDDSTFGRRRVSAPTRIERSTDDSYLATHYVPLQGPIQWRPHFSMPVWSWGSEYTVTGDPEALFEYLYYVIIGRPRA